MSVFQTVTPTTQSLDPLKRVNYTFGLVLGVDEFRQEQTYVIEKDRSQYRLAHGYGTICGLRVRVVDGVNLEVRVAPGVAINPQGQEIHVQKEMCAKLNDWLTNNKDALQALFGTPPTSLSLCVVLCYRECQTDSVPVPGEPCRTQQDTMAASRIAESFQLKLCVDWEALVTSPPGSPAVDPALANRLCYRPPQVEEDHIREFGELLQRIRITDAAVDFIGKQQLEDLVRQLRTPTGSLPLASPALSSPPWAGPALYLHPHDAREFLRAAFLVWVTEVRPTLEAQAEPCAGQASSEQCVLLAELNLSVNGSWQVTGAVTIDESRRPFLIQSRLLQESLLCGGAGTGGGFSAGSVVAAGTYLITAGGAIAFGPTYNELTAVHQAGSPDDGLYLLHWSGSPAYVNPETASPATHTYLVNGTAMAKSVPKAVPLAFEVLAFQDDGILVRVVDALGNATAAGFMVEIKAIGMAGL